MAKEIERKFLVSNQSYKNLAVRAIDIRQGYLCCDPERTVRVRTKGNCGYITVKGISNGCERDEWEYEIPYADAAEMLDRISTGNLLSKTRFVVPCGEFVWEVDEFHGSLEGLVVAEVELPSANCEITPLPDFVGQEVTGNPEYYNSSLALGIKPHAK